MLIENWRNSILYNLILNTNLLHLRCKDVKKKEGSTKRGVDILKTSIKFNIVFVSHWIYYILVICIQNNGFKFKWKMYSWLNLFKRHNFIEDI